MGNRSKKVKAGIQAFFSGTSKGNASSSSLDTQKNVRSDGTPEEGVPLRIPGAVDEEREPNAGISGHGLGEHSNTPPGLDRKGPERSKESATHKEPEHDKEPQGSEKTSQMTGNLNSKKSADHKGLRGAAGLEEDLQFGDDWRQASNAIWKRAYERFAADNQSLSEMYETIIKADAGCSQNLDVKTQMKSVVKRQQESMEEKQWAFQLWGSSKRRKVRDTIDGLFSITKSSSSMISAGMTLAPVYVSLPWSAVSALIPFIMNDTAQQKGAIEGVRDVTRIIQSYNIAEKTYLSHGNPELKLRFADAVLDLYLDVLIYQAKAIRYFGERTLINFMKNLTQLGVDWKDESSGVGQRQAEAQRNLTFLGPDVVGQFFHDQTRNYELRLQSLSTQRELDDAILAWLSPSPFEGHFRVAKDLGPRYVSSNQWILKLQEYEDWKVSSDQVLWLEGGVGTGKSSIVFSIIEDMMRECKGRLCFFYYSRSTGTDQDQTITMIRSLLRQLARRIDDPSLYPTITDFYKDNKAHNPVKCELDIDKCFELLEEVVGPNDQISLIIDALDECADLDNLLSYLKKLRDDSGRKRKLRILFTSRFGAFVHDHFPDAKRMEILDKNADDIENYLNYEVPTTEERGRLHNAMTDKQAERLRIILRRRAQGSFRWVKLEVGVFLPLDVQARPKDPLDVESNLKALETTTSSVPDMLKDAYDQVYDLACGPINQPRRRAMVNAALKWVLCSFRDLKLSELAHAIAVTSIDTPNADIIKNNIKMLPEACSNLLTHDGSTGSDLIRISHLSVKEYLEERNSSNGNMGDFKMPICHAQAALTCLLYKRGFVEAQTEMTFSREFSSTFSNTGEPGFPSYAITYWPRHYFHAFKEDRLIESLTAYLMNHHVLDQILQLGRLGSLSSWAPNEIQNDSARFQALFRHAARRGEEVEVESMIAMGIDLSFQNEFGDTVLHEAIDWGRTGVVEIILGYASQDRKLRILDTQNFSGNTPAHRAAFWGDLDIVRILKDHKARLDLLNNNVMSESDVFALETKQHGKDDGESVTQNPKTLLFASNPRNTGQKGRYISNNAVLPIAPLSLDYLGVKFDAITLCRFCDPGLWILRPTSDFYHEHHRTYFDLEESASTCRLCALFVSEICKKGYEFKDCDEPSSYVSIRSAFAKVSESSRGPQDLITVLVGENAKVDLEIFDTRGSETLETFHTLSGRPLASSAAEESCFDLARSWLKDCISSHTNCSNFDSSVLPSRIVQIEKISGDGRFHLSLRPRKGDNEQGRFAYLSHVWGIGRIPNTTLRNFEHRQVDIPNNTLPDEWQEAITVLWELGINYIWVDALCTLQDSAEDWVVESQLIGRYITDATVVLACGTGTSSMSSLFASRTTENFDILPYTQQRGTSRSTGALQLRRPPTRTREAVSETSLGKRAWMMQEMVLSERVLYYGDEQLYWNCQTSLLSEASISREEPMWTIASLLRAMSNEPAAISPTQLWSVWYRLVEEYTTKILSYHADRLPAFETIARAFTTNDDKYLAGLWKRDLHRALLWVGRSPVDFENTGQYIAPSWSWASFQGPIRYELAEGIRLPLNKSSAIILDIGVSTKQGLGFPRVVSGYLTLKALSLKIRSDHKIASCSYIFDTKAAEDSWEAGQSYIGVLIARWSLGWTDVGSHWVGLILAEELGGIEPEPESNDLPGTSFENEIPSPTSDAFDSAAVRKYKRVGLLNGPTYSEDMFGWEVRKFTII